LRNHGHSRKSIIFTYSESVFVALGNQHATRMHHNVIYSLPDYNIFQRYLINSMFFLKQDIERKMCVLIFSTIFERFLFLGIVERDMI
jgi:hypothetical protein